MLHTKRKMKAPIVRKHVVYYRLLQGGTSGLVFLLLVLISVSVLGSHSLCLDNISS